MKYPAWVKKRRLSAADFRLGYFALKRYLPLPAPPDSQPWYHAYLRTSHWREFRALVLISADFTCARCGGIARDVHHISYERRGHEQFDDVEPLCRECHEAAHGIMHKLESPQRSATV